MSLEADRPKLARLESRARYLRARVDIVPLVAP